MRIGLLVSAALAAGILAPLTATAQEWPSKPIKMIVPFPPGGGTDILSRVVANQLTVSLKQAIVVENKPGAGGNIGLDLAAKSAPDGYTIVMGQTSNLAINPTLYGKLPYDPVKDFAPVALVADAPVAIVVGAQSTIASFADLIASAKAKPGDITYGSPGNGTVSHLSGELLQRSSGAKLLHVPYKGSGPALIDLIGGRLDVFMASVPSALSHINGGKIRALAVTTAARSPSLPNVPTVAEAGVPGFETTTWYGILVPAGTPAVAVEKLNAAVNAAIKAPEVTEKIAGEGGAPIGGSADKFAALLKAEIAKWSVVVKESGAKVD